MIPTLHARAIRTRQMELPLADLLIVDECHHATAHTWHRIIDAYPSRCRARPDGDAVQEGRAAGWATSSRRWSSALRSRR